MVVLRSIRLAHALLGAVIVAIVWFTAFNADVIAPDGIGPELIEADAAPRLLQCGELTM
jgi:hypothetical protein